MLRTAQALMFDPALVAEKQKRVCWCNRTIRTMGEQLAIFRTDAGTGARLAGLATCGSVWHCPVCAAKITESRRRELDLAVTAWIKHQGAVNLLTLTFPHESDWPLADLLARFGKALQGFKNSKGYKRIMGGADRAGSIRSLETTWGEHGWHPHTHDLVFIKGEISDADVDELSALWVRQVIKAGLASLADQSKMLARDERKAAQGTRGCIALTLQDGRYAAEYIAKFGHDSAWGVSAEMTKPHAKLGAVREFDDHYTPFQLLAWAQAGDEKAAALFREFADAFEGKRMLSWSPKLRLLLTGQENELSDAELAAHDDPAPEETRVAFLAEEQFETLTARNKVGEFLTYVARCCWSIDTAQEDVDAYVAAIAALPASHSGRYRRKRSIGGGFIEIDRRM